MKKTKILLLLLLVCGLAWLAWDVRRAVFQPLPGVYPKTVLIPGGTSVKGIARILQREGIIRRPSYFYWYYRIFYRHMTLKSGEYRFEVPQTMKQTILFLNEGRVMLEKLVITEGLTIHEIAKVISDAGLTARADFLAACGDLSLIASLDRNARDLEGYLFPDTYMVRRGMSAAELVRMMVANFRRHFPSALVWRCRDISFSIRQAVTLASLIEKETSAPEERYLISSVFHNRLHRGMALDCDPTIVYALERDNHYDGKLGWDDLKYESPYNTRLHRGLPPGPICNPGLAAIQSALYPADSNYLYFVSKDGHVHQFSESLQEHNRAVHKYIIQHNAPRVSR